jgi:beta-lactamase superfamily II metal-dependent hydrolase
MTTKYVGVDDTGLFTSETGNQRIRDLLWGDRVIVEKQGVRRSKVFARSSFGWIDNAALDGQPLLEVYFIDVGQGDGVLIRTPDGRHIMIDGGYKRSSQPTGRNAADFVDWKFVKEYGEQTVHLDAMIASHCDADHYGGLWDLINPDETKELDNQGIKVERFYHAGVGWWQDSDHKRYLGSSDNDFLTRLLGNRASLGKAVKAGAEPRLQGDWGSFMRCVYDLKCPVERLSQRIDYLPGFDPAPGEVAIRVLGPVEHDFNGKPALRSLGDNSQNTNGHSILLRLDYGRARILLTGDLNQKSQHELLEEYKGKRQEFACDVAKGCHHGSDDCSYEFLSALGAACTIISSGDNESHAHPRPSIVAASAQTGHTRIRQDKLTTPLVYSTEIARSVRIGRASKVLGKIRDAAGQIIQEVELDPADVTVFYDEIGAGDLAAKKGTKRLDSIRVIPGIIYGLVNVRTDGDTILCANLNEKNSTWDIKKFTSRF